MTDDLDAEADETAYLYSLHMHALEHPDHVPGIILGEVEVEQDPEPSITRGLLALIGWAIATGIAIAIMVMVIGLWLT